MLRCCIYIRVSTEFDSQKSSLTTQEEILMNFIKQQGWSFVETYCDIRTATKCDRTRFDEMMDDALSDKFDIILSKDVSRLVRNFKIGIKLQDLYEEHNIHIVTFDKMVDTLNGDLKFFPLLIFFSQLHSQELSEKLKISMKNKASNGKFIGSIAPYGYYKDTSTQTLCINTDNTPDIVRRIYAEYISGKGFDSIAKGLTKDNIPSPRKNSKKGNSSDVWQGSTVRLILENRHYCGDLLQCKTSTKTITSKQRVKCTDNNYVICENAHESIISKEEFFIVQELINKRRTGAKTTVKHLYSGIAYCSCCGHSMHYIKNRSGYVCGTYNKRGKEYCSSHAIKEEHLNESILNIINSSINTIPSSLYDVNISAESEIFKINKNYSKAVGNLDSLRSKRKTLTLRFINNELPKAAYDELYDDLTIKIAEIEVTISNLKNKLDKANKTELTQLIATTIQSAIVVKEVTPEILNTFISKIYITEYGIGKIEFNFS